MSEDCKMDLPIIKWAKYQNYINKDVYRFVYSDLRWGTYSDGRDVGSGASPGIDIATSSGTPIYAIGDGVVVQAGFIYGDGNSVTIKHTIGSQTLYSSYSHLSVYTVAVGDRITEWQQIGEVGKTGTTFGAYGNHLDFQITTTKQKSYPYSYRNCSGNYYTIIEKWLCRDMMTKHTIDPIAFLESQGWTLEGRVVLSTRDEKSDPVVPIITQPLARQSSHKWKTSWPKKSDSQLSYQIIGLDDADEWVTIGRRIKFYILVKNTRGGDHDGNLAETIHISDSKGLFALSDTQVTKVSDGIIKVTATAQSAGATHIELETAQSVIGRYAVQVTPLIAKAKSASTRSIKPIKKLSCSTPPKMC